DRHNEKHCEAAPEPNPIAPRRATLLHRRSGQAPSNAKAATILSRARPALSFRQRGKHVTIAVHERLTGLNLLLHPRVESGDDVSGRSFDGEGLLALLGVEMPEHFLGQDKAGGCSDFPELEREHDSLQTIIMFIIISAESQVSKRSPGHGLVFW